MDKHLIDEASKLEKLRDKLKLQFSGNTQNEESWLDSERSLALILESGCTHDITINTYENKSADWAAKRADIFTRRMAMLIGKVTGEKDFDGIVQRQNWIRFTELKSGNRHMHCVATFNDIEDEVYRKRGKHVWAKIAKKGTANGKLFMRKYDSSDTDYKQARYNTKENNLI